MAFPYINAYQQFFDSSGDPLVSGTIEFRDPTTNSLINSYPTADDADAQTNANDNPLTLNASGAASSGLYLEDGVAYKVILKDSTGATVKSDDDVRCPIALPYLETAAETAASVTVVNIEYPPGNVLRYGTNTTPGTTDMQSAFDAASLQMKEDTGANVFIPPDTYFLGSQWTIQAPAFKRCEIMAYGAEITTSGAIAGVQLWGGSTTGGCAIYGLEVNHRGNADATFGFELYKAWNSRLVDCSVVSHDTAAGYACYLLRNGTASDTSTGCFQTVLDHCQTRLQGGADGTFPEAGIRIRGACNATNILNCKLSQTVTAVHHTIESGETYLANALYLSGNHFQTYTTAYHLEGAASSTIRGVTFVGNRYEAGTTVYSMTGTTAQPAQAPFALANNYISDAGTYLNNPNSLYFSALDNSVTPDGLIQFIIDSTPALYQNIKASTHAMALRVQTAGYGLSVQSSDGTERAKLTTRSGGGGLLRFTDNLGDIAGVHTISGTATVGSNLRGTATFATSGTVAVTFGTAEPDANYFLVITGDTGETYSWSAKATSGFTITSSNASSTATVDWILIR